MMRRWLRFTGRALACTISSMLWLTWAGEAQTNAQRTELVTRLNAGLNALGPDTVNLTTVTLLDTTRLRDPFGSCFVLNNGDQAQLEKIGGGLVRLRLEVSPASASGQVPMESHPIICELQGWQYRCLTEEHSDLGNAALGFAQPCSGDVSQQRYWLLDDQVHHDQWTAATELRTYWPYWDESQVGMPGELLGIPLDECLVPRDQLFAADTTVKWIVKRVDGVSGAPDTLLAQRARGKLVVNWSFGAEVGFEFNSKPPTVVSLEFEVSVPALPGNQCVHAAYSPTAKVVYTLRYNDGIERAIHKTYDDFPASPEAACDSLWSFLSHTHWPPSDLIGLDEEGYGYVTFHPDAPGQPVTAYFPQFRSRSVPAETCEMVFPLNPAESAFALNPLTGDICFLHGAVSWSQLSPSEGDVVEKVSCLDFCERQSAQLVAGNVLSANAVEMRADWEYDPVSLGPDQRLWPDEYDPLSDNPFGSMPVNRFEAGCDNKWRAAKSLVYRSGIKPGAGGTNVIYDDAGVFVAPSGSTTNAFTQFIWSDPGAMQAPEWLRASTVTQYAPSGEAVEELDALGISSAAKLSSANASPLLVAHNARYGAVDFNSFEDWAIGGADGVVADVAHAGVRSYRLPSAGIMPADTMARVVIDASVKDHGLTVKVWAKQTYEDVVEPVPIKIAVGSMEFWSPPTPGESTSQYDVVHRVAQTGEWSLYAVSINPTSIQVDTGTTLIVKVSRLLDSSDVWVDDLRVQPTESQMTCYVVEAGTLRLSAQFDDQHFGRYYQYNGEGKLVRVLVETERGTKTVAETQYNGPVEQRPLLPAPPGVLVAQSVGEYVPPVSARELRERRLALARAPGERANGWTDQFQLLGLELTPDGLTTSLLGDTPIDVERLDSVFRGLWDRIRGTDADTLARLLPNVDAERRPALLKELLDVEKEIAVAEEGLQSPELDDKAREQMWDRLTTARKLRESLLSDRMDLDVHDRQALYESLGIPKGPIEVRASTRGSSK